MNKKIGPAVVLTIVLTCFLFSCSITKLTQVQKNENYKGGLLNSVMVVGVSDNLKNRKIFEKTFVEAFEKNGLKAVAGTSIFSPKQELSKGSIKAAATKAGVDAVMVTHLVEVKETEAVKAPLALSDPNYLHMGPYYQSIYHYVNQPDYSMQHKFVRLQTNLYETESESLIWAASSETFDPQSVNEVVETLSGVIIKNLRESSLIK